MDLGHASRAALGIGLKQELLLAWEKGGALDSPGSPDSTKGEGPLGITGSTETTGFLDFALGLGALGRREGIWPALVACCFDQAQGVAQAVQKSSSWASSRTCK